jgi:rubrerythrin
MRVPNTQEHGQLSDFQDTGKPESHLGSASTETYFRNKHELEIMGEIGKYEKLALDLYTDILEALKKSDVKRLLRDDKDADNFMSHFEQLISDEKEHMDLTKVRGDI